MGISLRDHLPGLRRTILARHKYATVAPDFLRLVHGFKESWPNGHITRSHSFYFFIVQSKTGQKQCHNRLARVDFLSVQMTKSLKIKRDVVTYFARRKLPARSSKVWLASFVNCSFASASSHRDCIEPTWACSSFNFCIILSGYSREYLTMSALT